MHELAIEQPPAVAAVVVVSAPLPGDIPEREISERRKNRDGTREPADSLLVGQLTKNHKTVLGCDAGGPERERK